MTAAIPGLRSPKSLAPQSVAADLYPVNNRGLLFKASPMPR